MGDDLMSDRAQRVLDALMDYDAENGTGYPISTIYYFLDSYNNYEAYDEDYEALTVDEEKQVIKAFLEFAY